MVQIVHVALAKAASPTDGVRGVHTIKVRYIYGCDVAECAGTPIKADMDLWGDDTSGNRTIGRRDDSIGRGIDPHPLECSEGELLDLQSELLDPADRMLLPGDPPSSCGWRAITRTIVIGAGIVSNEDSPGDDEIYVNLKLTPLGGTTVEKRSLYVRY